MTRERAKQLLPVITAFANGETIQCRTDDKDQWEDVDHPAWDYHMDYRVKPKPREWEIIFVKSGKPLVVNRGFEIDAPYVARVHVREVLVDTEE